MFANNISALAVFSVLFRNENFTPDEFLLGKRANADPKTGDRFMYALLIRRQASNYILQGSPTEQLQIARKCKPYFTIHIPLDPSFTFLGFKILLRVTLLW